MAQDSWTVEWDAQRNWLRMRIAGHGTLEMCERVITRFERMGKMQRFVFVADIGQMTGYDSEVRRKWIGMLRGISDNIAAMYVVGPSNPVVKLGAQMVGGLAGLPLKVVATIDQVPTLKEEDAA